jgi:hypothetical protein
MENLAHVSRVVRASIDGRALGDDELSRRLPFLREAQDNAPFTASRAVAVTFAPHDQDVRQLYAGLVWLRRPGTLTMALHDERGREVYRHEVAVEPRGRSILETVPPGTRASTLVLIARSDGENLLTLADVRVEGQSGALADYVRRTLTFPGR